jgi:hypothetical protein
MRWYCEASVGRTVRRGAGRHNCDQALQPKVRNGRQRCDALIVQASAAVAAPCRQDSEATAWIDFKGRKALLKHYRHVIHSVALWGGGGGAPWAV